MLRTLAAVAAAGILQLTPVPFTETAVISAFQRVDSRFVHYRTIFKQPIDATQQLVIVRAAREPITWLGRDGELPWGHDELLGVFLMDRRDASRVWEIVVLTDHTPLGPADLSGRSGVVLDVERLDRTSVVLSQREIDHWNRVSSIKLFFDPTERRLLKRIDYPPINAAKILRADDRLCAALTTDVGSGQTGETPARQICIERDAAIDRGALVLKHDTAPEGPLDLAPLPQSTYDEFARARPDRARTYTRATTRIDELIGPTKRVGRRVWFGKFFYDGEGTSGVGDLGYFDTVARTYFFFHVPEMAPWSTSALLMEGNDAWVALIGQYELATQSYGLLRVDTRNRRTRRFDIRDIIGEIVRWNGALYLATDDGLYVLRGDRLTRYRFEPTLNGELAIVREVLTR